MTPFLYFISTGGKIVLLDDLKIRRPAFPGPAQNLVE